MADLIKVAIFGVADHTRTGPILTPDLGKTAERGFQFEVHADDRGLASVLVRFRPPG